MRVLLLNPPYYPLFSRSSRSPAVAKSGTLYYPIYLAYATGYLEEQGHEVLLLDSPAMDMDRQAVVERARGFAPGLVVVDTSTPSIYNDAQVAAAVKAATGAFTVLVGTHVSALPDESLALEPSVDAVVRREYEATLGELALTLEQGGDPARVQGLTLRRGDKIVTTPDRPFIDDLDGMPFVSRVYKKHLASCLDRYFYGANLYPVVTILSGRGCPHRCTYCVYPQTFSGRRYRYRSVENVVDELAYIKKEFPRVKEIFLEDDTLTINPKRAQALADEIMRRGLRITWSCNSRADVDLQTLQKLKAAGCRLLCVGFESGDQEVLDNIKKGVKVEQFYRFAKDAKKAGLLVHGCFLVGNQGESPQSMGRTLDLAKILRPDTAQFFPIMIYPGTEAYQWASQQGFITVESYDQWLTPEGLHNCVVSTDRLGAAELVEFCDQARRSFYLSPRYMLSKLGQVVTSPRETKRILRAAKTLARYIFRTSHDANKPGSTCKPPS